MCRVHPTTSGHALQLLVGHIYMECNVPYIWILLSIILWNKCRVNGYTERDATMYSEVSAFKFSRVYIYIYEFLKKFMINL